jgi:hypothetical protein
MRRLFFFIWVLSLKTFSQETDSVKVSTQKANTEKRILIINTYNAAATDQRKNKKELFGKLADSLQSLLAERIQKENLGEPVIIKELTPPIFDSKARLDSLFNLYSANYAIVIKKLDAYFDQTNVEVTKNDDGSKSREASYDLCTEVSFGFYKANDKPYHSETKNCDPFTSRNVMSGLLAGGPDIVGKSKHVFKAIATNANLYIWEIRDQLKEKK